ncbi:MAG: hypothetical protein EKK40_15580 [Bradyrhizobiaceae bacterium]|nr:MAG: hypothetical protein EKK40_15580 [Bradyrhizobiaceae bacterium]
MTRGSAIFDVHQRARFMRPDARRWIRPDTARWRRPLHPDDIKYSPDQPRDERGRWTDSGNGFGLPQNTEFNPDQPGWHDYSNESLVCPADLFCSSQEMADQLARFSVPGRSASMPVDNNAVYNVFIPSTDIYVGNIQTKVSGDGLTITNRTQPGHIFFDGIVERSAIQADDGAWYVTTRGIGNNVAPGMNMVNQVFGPDIFNGLDRQIRINIELHHGRKSFMASALAPRAALATSGNPGVLDVVVGAKAHA